MFFCLDYFVKASVEAIYP